MHQLLRDEIPHAPRMGLFVAPNIPESRLTNALDDYAHSIRHDEVLALYDATLSGNAKDGAVFAVDRFIFQNTDLEAPKTVHYRNLLRLELKQRWFGIAGRKIELTLQRGASTLTQTMDFSGQPEAADYVETFLQAALHRSPPDENAQPPPPSPPDQPSEAGAMGEEEASGGETDGRAVRQMLARLHAKGKLSAPDLQRLLEVLSEKDDAA